MLMGMNFAFALAAGSLAVLLFRFSTNYVPMLLKATPLLLTVGLVIADWALESLQVSQGRSCVLFSPLRCCFLPWLQSRSYVAARLW